MARGRSPFSDEAAMVLGTRSRMNGGQAMVAKTVDAATEAWSIASVAMHSLTLIAHLIVHLIVQNVGLHINLQGRGYTKS